VAGAAAAGGKIGVDRGSGVTFVHDNTQKSPASPNPPRKRPRHRTGKRISVQESLMGLMCLWPSGPRRMRASHADREHVIEVLKYAFASGRPAARRLYSACSPAPALSPWSLASANRLRQASISASAALRSAHASACTDLPGSIAL
jgi:hypothetical protein